MEFRFPIPRAFPVGGRVGAGIPAAPIPDPGQTEPHQGHTEGGPERLGRCRTGSLAEGQDQAHALLRQGGAHHHKKVDGRHGGGRHLHRKQLFDLREQHRPRCHTQTENQEKQRSAKGRQVRQRSQQQRQAQDQAALPE
jgi:hypothetical protein